MECAQEGERIRSRPGGSGRPLPLMSIVRQERLLWTTLGLAAGAASYLDIKVRRRRERERERDALGFLRLFFFSHASPHR